MPATTAWSLALLLAQPPAGDAVAVEAGDLESPGQKLKVSPPLIRSKSVHKSRNTSGSSSST